MPTLTVIAGPNGSGKSTLTRFVDFEGRGRLLDPDEIARRLNPLDPYTAAIAAGREVLKRTADYLAWGLSFAVETTLSSRGRMKLILDARSRGFETQLVFLGVDSPERCITRIRNRAAQGGHVIPDADVRRRYTRSMANARQALRSVDIANYYDSSGETPRLILAAASGVVLWQADTIPEWVKF